MLLLTITATISTTTSCTIPIGSYYYYNNYYHYQVLPGTTTFTIASTIVVIIAIVPTPYVVYSIALTIGAIDEASGLG